MSFRARLARIQANRRCSTKAKSSFDVDLVSQNYAQRTEWAAANFGNRGTPFRMVLPPPNVTGKLHLGHALTVTVEDALCRHHRIKGGVATWLPGFDHAGIATQSVVERELWKERGLQRHQMSREEFVDLCRQWSEKNSSVITEQMKRMGATLDWNNCYYTLDKRFSSAVTRAFCELHGQDLIYRDRRLVNWCPQLRSSLSDQEVERIDVEGSSTITVPSPSGGKRSVKVGVMHKVKYELSEGESFLEVATTRPETVFADVALAVHPDDNRYSQLIGRCVKHALIEGRKLPIIADEAVKMDKGTGVVKITPSHDHLDFEIASRHWPTILEYDEIAKERCCLDENGKLTDVPLEYLGLDRFEARDLVLCQLRALNLYGGAMKHESAQLTICSRTGDIIEPRLTEQWFMHTAELHRDAEAALGDGRIKVIPQYQEQRLFDWFANQEPWCLSRQLLWGHRIPAYKTESSDWVIADSAEKAALLLGSEAVRQDEDVLDTWFSSSLVPLVTAGWMEGTFNREEVPIDTLETGWDISGFWVARMIMLTMRLSGGQVPFSQVLLHGLVRDGNGRKMSKSLGNVIDPLDVLDGISKEGMIERLKNSALDEKEIAAASSAIQSGIPKAGADALRFALLRHDVLATDIPINVAELAAEGSRFCNKLWNLIAYMESVNEKCRSQKEFDSDAPQDAWIISRLAATLQQVDSHMADRAPHLAFGVLHQFILANLCDVYLETTKSALWQNETSRLEEIRSTLTRVVQPTLVQLSVFMPFVAEHLYERIFSREKGSIYFDFVKASFFAFYRDEELEDRMRLALLMTAAVRSVRQQLQLPAKMVFEGILLSSSQDITDLTSIVRDLGGLQLKEVIPPDSPIPKGYMPCTLKGTDDKMALRIEEEHRGEFVERLQRQLTKSVERQQQFLAKAEKYEEIAERDREEGKVKPSVIEKSVRKAKQAGAVASGAREESERLRRLLKDVNKDFRKKENDS